MLTAIEQKTGMKFSPKDDEDYLPVEQFVTKPVEPDELVKRVKQLLAAKAPGA
jgi:CheY-like chemotaxis protein